MPYFRTPEDTLPASDVLEILLRLDEQHRQLQGPEPTVRDAIEELFGMSVWNAVHEGRAVTRSDYADG